ncbi:hypothetical protein EV667_1136 [Ancylobacter aquaticus]|uniref:Uncharacterized protein n=1 Tax=Ancylobacter aquaticus TaxID=100 RepID=A0A4R1I9S1_ANCAQ|nr:hypothetical protein [Ancylobacter aquaticus]TCK31031.1 hypothetical protein EV667_1136 [Ancylobacter aquaticus]
MIDKLEPSIAPQRMRADEENGAPRASAAPSAPAARAKGPPQDPVAFQRWLGIEQLKVQMRRLELENKRAEAPASRAAHPALPVLYGLVLVILLALVAFLAAQVLNLREDVAALRSAQGIMAERLQALEMPPPPPQALAPEAAPPAAMTPAAPATSLPSPALSSPSPADALVPLAGTTPMPAEAEPATPALPGAGYTVRIFAPINTVAKARVDAFTAPLKAAGFDVVVSDTGVVQTTSNTLSFHAGSGDMANEVAEMIQKRRPALSVELRASPSIPESARQVLILNLTEDAFN